MAGSETFLLWEPTALRRHDHRPVSLTKSVFRGHHRQVRVLFGASDAILSGAGLSAGLLGSRPYRAALRVLHPPSEVALLLVWSMLVWVGLGYWWEIYDRIDATHPRVILRDAFRQCLLGAGLMVLFQYLLRLDLSRFFVAIFAGFAWFLMCLFRLNAGRVLGLMRREFGGRHFVMVVGPGRSGSQFGTAIGRRLPLRHTAHRIPGGRARRIRHQRNPIGRELSRAFPCIAAGTSTKPRD